MANGHEYSGRRNSWALHSLNGDRSGQILCTSVPHAKYAKTLDVQWPHLYYRVRLWLNLKSSMSKKLNPDRKVFL